MRRAIFIAPFDELSEPARVAELAERAERRGWDGFFLWDHIDYRPPVTRLADPWITMTAIVMRTERLITGPLVTPLARRRTAAASSMRPASARSRT
jgi:alkanesulfonate monooxygenase SsuD/methylene tetrahydromethanopterin reductase-like flavin-dependent oxidoreductase (luciferase family)